MSGEISFSSQIAKIRRRVLIHAIHKLVLDAALIFLAINTLNIIFIKAGISNYHINGTWYFVSSGISLSAAFFIGLVRRHNFLHVLIDIDRRFKLQDRLSTAYEYLKLKKSSEFADLLMNDAAVKLRRINHQQLMPVRFSFLHVLVIILLTINILLSSSIFSIPDFKTTGRELQLVENARKLVKNYTISRIDRKAASEIKISNRLRQKIRAIQQ